MVGDGPQARQRVRRADPAKRIATVHGRGVDDIIGIDDKGQPRTDKSGYQHDFALQVVEHGMAAVAIEQLAFGCRRDEPYKPGVWEIHRASPRRARPC